MYTVTKYFLIFMIYSMVGWVIEEIVTLVGKKKLVNRGFLIGPYLPIYGSGTLIVLFVVGSNTTDYFAVFLKSMVLCSTLEYLTSFVMEKLFKVRWWDYSEIPFNLNGRICLRTMIPFGLLGLVVTNFVQPYVLTFVESFSQIGFYVTASVLLTIFIIDNIVSIMVLGKIRHQITLEKKDNTDKVHKYIDEWLKENMFLYKRIRDSFPKFQIILKKNKDKIKKGIFKRK